ncbi:lipoate--protein ligase family protein [Alkalihalobacillus oceani]|uniref:Octanoyl-[GcvH]:protein N-octanoyltransferase n=1 Tax=Halalkalibacter oceani TaxID=1653776 RepID=A0A9X2DNJ8_9BACI|nr:biotin/lipoate A/B protein ligase family protein [Halalkalibacter oceani]MCM3714206.1 lipoate--protein ligase family protein [Halalkalibacter oceani]
MNYDLQTISPQWRWLDQTRFGPAFDALQSFAYDDTFCTLIGQKQAVPLVRTWVHHDTVVLGIQDTRLPAVEAGCSYLEEQGYRVIVRNSGGLAVLLDSGILNISLLLPEIKGMTIDAAYEQMYSTIKELLADYERPIQAYEIVGSYCPGSYDLSIDGKKFAGISQRRIRGGIAVQIYLCVEGSGSGRAALLRDFYHLAVPETNPSVDYPLIQPATMASLAELLDSGLTVAGLNERLLHLLQQKVDVHPHLSSTEETALFSTNYERIASRNEKRLTQKGMN